jgi:hypothetical protein
MNRKGERLPILPELAPKLSNSQPEPIALCLELFQSCFFAQKLAPPSASVATVHDLGYSKLALKSDIGWSGLSLSISRRAEIDSALRRFA